MESHETLLSEINAKLAALRMHLCHGAGTVQNYESTRQELMTLIYQCQDRLDYQVKTDLMEEIQRLMMYGMSPSFSFDGIDEAA